MSGIKKNYTEVDHFTLASALCTTLEFGQLLIFLTYFLMLCVLVRNETDLEFFPYALQSQHRTVMSTPSITTTSMQAEEGKSTTNAPGLKITHDGNQRDQKLSPIDLSTPPSGGISLMDGASKDPPKASVVVVELCISKSAGDYRLQRTTIFRMIYTKDNG